MTDVLQNEDCLRMAGDGPKCQILEGGLFVSTRWPKPSSRSSSTADACVDLEKLPEALASTVVAGLRLMLEDVFRP